MSEINLPDLRDDVEVQLRPDRFDGLIELHPLYRHGADSIAFVIEHHSKKSRGIYRAERHGQIYTSTKLEDVVRYYNEH